MNLLAGQKTPETVDPGTAVMISANHHNLRLGNSLPEIRQKMVENFHCFGGRDRLVINIPGDYHRVRRLLQGQTDNLVKYIFLVFPQVPVDQLQADVQVGKVKKIS